MSWLVLIMSSGFLPARCFLLPANFGKPEKLYLVGKDGFYD
jgi:hypothetical protein